MLMLDTASTVVRRLLQSSSKAGCVAAPGSFQHLQPVLCACLSKLLPGLPGRALRTTQEAKSIEFQHKAKKIDTVPTRPLPLGEKVYKVYYLL